jgi:hypothetical protein
MTQHDILVDPAHTVFAINCKIEGSTLHCGALYVEPLNPFQLIRLTHLGVSLDVQLPDEAINQTAPTRAWSIALPITNE